MTNLFGIDTKPLLDELAKFNHTQAQIIALLKEIKEIIKTKP